MTRFPNRAAAGRALAALLTAYSGRSDVLVLGLPRGGVPVAFEITDTLHVSLDVMVVRKIGAPGRSEFALGAIASGGIIVLNDVAAGLFGDSNGVREGIAREHIELKRREALYRNDRPALKARGRTVILVDDGAATGASMQAAVRATRKLGAARVVVALPVASANAVDVLRQEADEVICVLQPEVFHAVGDWYEEFDQTDDAEVSMLLAQAHAHTRRKPHVARETQHEQ